MGKLILRKLVLIKILIGALPKILQDYPDGASSNRGFNTYR
jgi:hypothetical protein